MKIDEAPSEAVLPTPHGKFKIRVFKEEETGMIMLP